MKKLTFTLAILFTVAFTHAQTIEQVYHFGQPEVDSQDGYQQINLDGCLPKGQVGEPTLPWQSVSLILPEGQKAVSMNVEFLDYVEMGGSFKLYPYQKPRPYSYDKEIPFAKNEQLYRSTNAYPSRTYGEVSTQYLNGVAFAFGGFTPVQYIPSTGKVSIARTAIVHIETTSSRDDHSSKLWLTPENEASVKRLAQNPSMLSSYSKRGRVIGGYDMLVITAEEWIPRFGEYLNLYNGKGIRSRIVALEEIYATMPGRDEQEQIRNYIIQEYENNGISMVSLGGDVSIVPYRSLYCWAQDEEEDQLPSDMYFACLDGTLNDDGDDRWGEVGEDDLLPELGIGRLPFNNEEQFNVIMGKTFSYLLNPVLGEFTSPILGAEHLGDGYYGSDDMERLIGVNNDFGYTSYGYPTDYSFKKYYASPNMIFSGSAFRDLIGTGGQYVHHVGHANSGIVAGWDIEYVGDDFFAGNNGVVHNYMLFHSHGCICGNFPGNCILEKMVTIPTGFVVTTGNSRYGWYVPWGDGMAAHIHRELMTAYCHDHIPSVGMALREAKIATAPWVTAYGEEGCLRWNIYCLNVLGDGALHPWFAEPITPDVSYSHGIHQGATGTSVIVKSNGRPLENYQVNLFKEGELICRSITDEEGNASLEFDDPSAIVGDLELIVTGQNAWPQCLPMKGLTDEPFLYVTDYGYYYQDNVTATLIAGETYDLETEISNPSSVNMSNIDVIISCSDEQIEIIQNHLVVPSIQAGSGVSSGPMFNFRVSDQAVDQARVLIDVTCSAEGQSWTTSIPVYLNAPVLQFADFSIEDLEGDHNGFADPGERVAMQVTGKNIGHAIAPDAYLTVSCDDERIQIENPNIPIGNVNADDEFLTEFVFTSNNDIEGGTILQFHIELHYGAYVTSYDQVLSIGIAVESFESGDFSFLKWEHGGEEPWFVTTDEAHSGNYSARTGYIEKNQFSRLLIYADILQDGEISFWFKTSTEYHKNYFAFYIDNRKKDWWSGENDWTYAAYDFQAGSHVFEWLYGKSKDNLTSGDCAWIDDITLPRTCLVTKVEEIVSERANAVYPNPNNGSFTLELAEESDIVISNILGQVVMRQSKVDGKQQIQLNDTGLYLIQIRNASGVETLKVVVE